MTHSGDTYTIALHLQGSPGAGADVQHIPASKLRAEALESALTMPLLLVLLELFVVTLAAWVPILAAALYWRISIGTLQVAFPLVWLLLIAVMAMPWARRLRAMGRRELIFALNTLVVGGLVGVLALVASRPDADDVGYFLQPMIDAASPSGPFTVDPFIVPFQGTRIDVAFLAENEAYEAMVVVLADLLGIDPLQAYHNVFAFPAAIVWVVTYALLFRRFRVPRSRVWLALLASVAFLMIDGNLHRSFGNFSLLRIWQGKVIVYAILMPAFTLFSLRFLARPSRYGCGLLVATSMASFFINRSSVFLFAVLATAIAVGYFLSFMRNRRRAFRALALAGTVAPFWVLGAYIAVSSFPHGNSLLSVFSEIMRTPQSPPNQPTWWASLNVLVIGGPVTLLRDVILLTLIPILVVSRPLNRFLPLLGLAVAILALSPLTGPVWYYFFPRVYWRMYYVLPLPLCAGLVVLLLSPYQAFGRRRVWRLATLVFVVLITGLAVDRPTLSTANDVQIKPPFEYRFHKEPLSFARTVARRLDGRLVLASSEVAAVLALTEQGSIDLVYNRAKVEGWHTANLANVAIEDCRVTRRTATAVHKLLRLGAEALIMSSCDRAVLDKLHKLIPEFRLEEDPELADSRFILFWVQRRPGS